jgi:hypothetical protein
MAQSRRLPAVPKATYVRGACWATSRAPAATATGFCVPSRVKSAVIVPEFRPGTGAEAGYEISGTQDY